MSKTAVRTLTQHQLQYEDQVFDLSHKPIDWIDPVVRMSNGVTVIGYLLHDDLCPNPLSDWDGHGRIYRRDRDASHESREFFNKYAGLDEYGNERRKPHRYGVPLDLYEHSLVRWSVAGTGMQCRWDTSRYAGIWVPDDAAMEVIRDQGRGLEKELQRRTRREFAVKLAEEACELYTNWCNGDCYGIVIERYEGGQHSEESRWGYVGSEHAEQSMVERVEEELGPGFLR